MLWNADQVMDETRSAGQIGIGTGLGGEAEAPGMDPQDMLQVVGHLARRRGGNDARPQGRVPIESEGWDEPRGHWISSSSMSKTSMPLGAPRRGFSP
jgi:hypothetical protein